MEEVTRNKKDHPDREIKRFAYIYLLGGPLKDKALQFPPSGSRAMPDPGMLVEWTGKW